MPSHLGKRLIAETQLIRAENQIRRAIFDALDEHERYVIESLKSAGLVAAAAPPDPFNESVWDRTIQQQVIPIIRIVLEAFIEKVFAALGLNRTEQKQVRGLVELEDYVTEYTNQIVSLGHITAGQVLEEINQGIAHKETTEQITRRVEDRFKITKSDAERIVRTETHDAAEGTKYDSAVAAHKSGCRTVKQWLSKVDHKVRPAHIRANGQEVDLFEDFELEEKGVVVARGPRPGKMGVASQDVNCRCGATYRRLGKDEKTPAKQTDKERDANERILKDEIKVSK